MTGRVVVVVLGLAGVTAALLSPACSSGSTLKPPSITASDAGSAPIADDTPCVLFDAGLATVCPTVAQTCTHGAQFRGRLLVENYMCAQCHNQDYSGHQRPAIESGLVFSGNITPDPTGIGCWTNAEIVNAILHDIDKDGTSLCVMPNYAGEGLDASAAEDMAEYLRSLDPVAKTLPASMCP